MPAKKNAKRGKIASKVETVPEAQDLGETNFLSEQKAMDSTFVVTKDEDGANKIIDGDIAEDQDASLGNGDASKDTNEDMKVNSKKLKGRPKTAIKKNEQASEPEAVVDNDANGQLSPKRIHEEASGGEETVEEPPAKRGRAKKAPTSKKGLKSKDVSEPIGNVDDNSETVSSSPDETPEETIPEEPTIKRGRGRPTAASKKDRKEKDKMEPEQDEEKPAKKKGRPAKESSEKDENPIEDIGESKTSRKRGDPKQKAVPEPSTRPTRARKPVVYEEIANGNDEDDEDSTVKKSKKVASKKATAAHKKNAKSTKTEAGSEKRNRIVKEVQREEEEVEE